MEMEALMKQLLLAVLFLPTIAFAQSVVAKQGDGSTWVLFPDTIDVGDTQKEGDRIVSALVEKRDAQGQSVHRARQYTTGCYVHADGQTRWGYFSTKDTWTWGGALVHDIIATRICQHAWRRVEPEAGITTTEPPTSEGRRV